MDACALASFCSNVSRPSAAVSFVFSMDRRSFSMDSKTESKLDALQETLEDYEPLVFINRTLEVSTDDANSVRRVASSFSSSVVRLSSNAYQYISSRKDREHAQVCVPERAVQHG